MLKNSNIICRRTGVYFQVYSYGPKFEFILVSFLSLYHLFTGNKKQLFEISFSKNLEKREVI